MKCKCGVSFERTGTTDKYCEDCREKIYRKMYEDDGKKKRDDLKQMKEKARKNIPKTLSLSKEKFANVQFAMNDFFPHEDRAVIRNALKSCDIPTRYTTSGVARSDRKGVVKKRVMALTLSDLDDAIRGKHKEFRETINTNTRNMVTKLLRYRKIIIERFNHAS